MSERSRKIEEAARALLDGSEGIKLNAGTAEVMNYWNRYRGLRADLRAALSLPPDAPDEYRRGVEDAAKVADECGEGIGNVGNRIRALAASPDATTDDGQDVRPCRCGDARSKHYDATGMVAGSCQDCPCSGYAPPAHADKFTNAVPTKEEAHGEEHQVIPGDDQRGRGEPARRRAVPDGHGRGGVGSGGWTEGGRLPARPGQDPARGPEAGGVAPPPAPAPGARCERCGGTGYAVFATRIGLDDWRAATKPNCPACGGRGKHP